MAERRSKNKDHTVANVLGINWRILTHTVHDIGSIEVRICLVDFRTITVFTNVVIEVPAHVLVKDGKYGLLLLVCFQLEANEHVSPSQC